MNKQIKIRLGVIALFALVLFGMRQSGPVESVGQQSALHGAPTSQVKTSSPSAALNVAPDFTLGSLDGGSIRLSDYHGEKPVILDFWASWCHNCQRSFPKTAKLYEKYSDEVEIIGVNMRESSAVASNFAQKNGANFPNVIDTPGTVGRNY